jgi:organic radical activating enzyme
MNEVLTETTQDGKILPIMEQFYTIQGEGANTGQPAYFIRTGGCDVGCVWCDVKESWDADAHPKYDVETIAENAQASFCPNVVITGGEPCMYNLSPLTSHLQSLGFNTWLETSGAHPITGDWDWIVFSPKKFKEPLPEAYQLANELKVVIANKHDFKWAEQHAQKVNGKAELFLQVEWSRREKLMPLVVEYVKAHPRWRISVQSHKYINVP